jgi:hypothetical protein
LSKIDIFFGQYFHEYHLWQRNVLASPFEKGDQRGISETVHKIPPTPLFKGGLVYDYAESGRI